jgi:uncharacterized protein (TIGR02594 family)
LKQERSKKDSNEIVNAEITYKSEANGCADNQTQEEIDRWLKDNYKKFVKPMISANSSNSVEPKNDTDPSWIAIARTEIGVKQATEGNTPARILEYHHATNLAEEWAIKHTTAWCSSFANWVMKKAKYAGTDNAFAVSWKKWGKKLDNPAYGCVAVVDFPEGGNHVGFIVGKRTYPVNRVGYLMLAGNQGKPRRVCITWFPADQVKYFAIPQDYTEPLSYELSDIKEDAGEGSYASTH